MLSLLSYFTLFSKKVVMQPGQETLYITELWYSLGFLSLQDAISVMAHYMIILDVCIKISDAPKFSCLKFCPKPVQRLPIFGKITLRGSPLVCSVNFLTTLDNDLI